MIQHIDGSTPTLGSWLVATQARVTRRPRAIVARAVRRELHRQLPNPERRLSETLDAPAFQARLEQEFARQWELRKAAIEPSAADVNRNFTTDVLIGRGARYDRTLTRERYARLADQIARLTGDRDVDARMRQAYRSILDAETGGLGRIAGSTYNIIGKLVVPPLLAPPPGPVLEIGTLFGLFAPALIRQFRRLGEFRHLTVVDPLEGTQIQPEMAPRGDPTGTPVTATVARHNLLHSGLAPDDFRIVQGLSTDPAIQAEAGDRRYAVVVIDGDHSEAGVYADLWWTQDLLLPGGIAVMDDFGDPKWPGVERATRRYLADGGHLQLAGTAATSAYLRLDQPRLD